jgi:catechol 2,3-dioxygenase-like lactoylglutathione lyase family enzyme
MINSINHIGVGSFEAAKTFAFFKDHFGFKFKMNDIKQAIVELQPLLREAPQMRVINCGCPYGGGFLEIFQYLDRAPRPKTGEYQWSNLGYLEAGIEVLGLRELYDRLSSRPDIPFLTGLQQVAVNDRVWDSVYIKTPDGYPLRLLDKAGSEGIKKPLFAGVHHVAIGVRNLETAVYFYTEIMGFDRMVFQGKLESDKLNSIMPSPGEAEIVILERSQGSTAKMSSYTGGMIFLIRSQNPDRTGIYHERSFGDPGISELGFDVTDIHTTYRELIRKGAQPLAEPLDFNWFPGPQGALAYVADYEGNILELIETQKTYGLDISVIDKMCVRPMRRLAKQGWLIL